MLNYRRRLPHLHTEGVPIFLNWRLHGSVPMCKRDALLADGRAFAAWDRALDRASAGPKWLAGARIASLVANAITREEFYSLHAWVIMPNHVHMLLTPEAPLPTITRRLKGFTAREANRLLNRTGPFWKDESWDRWVRDGHEFDRILRYIEQNPVAAGLVASPELWRWSSANWAGESACPTSACI